MEIITKASKETFELGRKIGSNLEGGKILALTGNLGAGKTTFIQGLAEGLGIKNKIVSPTFILMRQYDQGGRQLKLRHLDLYRLENDIEKEVENLGLFDMWKDKDSIVAIEWSEKIKSLLPKETVFINFENLDENKRRITIS
jgi:tRNA threonylcarbamoyladenosine biosynthesis protein TsaE